LELNVFVTTLANQAPASILLWSLITLILNATFQVKTQTPVQPPTNRQAYTPAQILYFRLCSKQVQQFWHPDPEGKGLHQTLHW
jgi:hypothetical protein